ncbi:hypothetical protein TURU_035746 [Turdus rufiventris]|nr:hypothetical protein TURU_035746 [Turdus rufiventris]
MVCPQDNCPPGLADGVREKSGPLVIKEETVRKPLKCLDIHTSMGPDGIHPRVMRKLSDELAKPLSIIYQQSWLTGEVPDDWKLASVTPIHKKGGKEDSGSYRSARLTSVPGKVIALADAAEENQANVFQAFVKLKSATHLVIMLISLWQKLSTDQVAILEATFLPLAEDTQELGWEETVDAAVSYLLRTCLSKSSKEQALTLSSHLSMPKDTSRLKKNITLFCDRLAKGGRLSLSTDLVTQQAAVMPGHSKFQCCEKGKNKIEE